MPPCTTLPAAAPPGTTRLAALPASCDTATTNQALVRNAIRSSAHSDK